MAKGDLTKTQVWSDIRVDEIGRVFGKRVDFIWEEQEDGSKKELTRSFHRHVVNPFNSVANKDSDGKVTGWTHTATDLSGATTINTDGYHNFRINTFNDPPDDFALLSPENASMVSDLTPIFQWEVPTDPDDRRNRSIVSYNHILSRDELFNDPIEITITENSYTPEADLIEDAFYYWKVIATDNEGGQTESENWFFWTNNIFLA